MKYEEDCFIKNPGHGHFLVQMTSLYLIKTRFDGWSALYQKFYILKLNVHIMEGTQVLD